MPSNNYNILFRTSDSKTIDNLLQSDGEQANTDTTATPSGTEITPGTVYFTSDGHIIYDLDSTHRLWMGKEAMTAIYANLDSDGNSIVDTYLTKADGVTNVSWDNNNLKLQQTINKKTSDILQCSAGDGIVLTAAAGSLTITNTATDALSGSPGAGKTITAFNQVNGAVSATFENISITKSQVSDFPTNVSDFENDVGYLTSYTETDPTVPAWAKASTKPSYSWTEITDKPSTFTPASHTHGNITNTGELDTASCAVVTDANKKITVANLTVSSATAETDTATTFVYSVTQDSQGKITVKTRPLPTYNNYTLPLAASGTRGGIQIGYSTSGKNYAVQLSNEKAYVNVPWTDTTYTVATGDTNGQIKITPSSGSAYNVSVKGLGSNAYTSTAYAPLASPGLTGTPTAPTATAGTNTTQIATTAFVQTAVSQSFAANDAMVFKGTLGTAGSVTSLPIEKYSAGWTYRVATAGTYAGEYCEVGDMLIAIQDGPTSGTSVIDTDWAKIEHNIDGALYKTSSIAYTGGKVLVSSGADGAVKEGTTSTENVVKTVTFNAGSVPTLDENNIAADDITAWNAGSTPTLGTAFSVPNVTANTSVTASKVTKTDNTVVKTISQAASTSSVIGTVSNGVLTFSKAITAVGAVSAGSTVTASAVTITDVTASKVTLGTAFSIPNVTDVGSTPSLSYTPRSIPNVTSVGTVPSLSTTTQSVITNIS